MKIWKRIVAPPDLTREERNNYLGVQLDAIGVGIANVAAPFLPIFLTRLGATSTEVGMLTTMPAITGLLLAIHMGRFLQKQKNIVRWYSMMRLSAILGYALTGLAAFIFAKNALVWGILGIWALITIPQTILSITFNVVMNAVAGPHSRFELMTRRWSILGLTTTCLGLLTGWLLSLKSNLFPLNYQIAFIVLSLGGVISSIVINRIKIDLPDVEISTEENPGRKGWKDSVRTYFSPILANKPFLSFIGKRLVVMFGITLGTPLFPLYYVREVHASDDWIAIISYFQTFSLVLGYFFWTRISRKPSRKYILLWTTLGVGIYPILVAQTLHPWQIAIIASVAGFFIGGLDLVFFDELMKLVPGAYVPTFVSFAQSLQYLSTMISPLVGTVLGDKLGLGPALMISGGLRLLGCLLFSFPFIKSRLQFKTLRT